MEPVLKEKRFIIPQNMLNMEKIIVTVLGVGGTGSHLIRELADVCYGLNHLTGKYLHVVAYDFDAIEPRNLGRSRFVPGDMGLSKTAVAISEANLGYGYCWENRHPDEFKSSPITFFCLDSLKVRKDYERLLMKDVRRGWNDDPQLLFDLGNDRFFGQLVMTDFGNSLVGLPATAQTSDDLNTPNCGDENWYERQDLFINRMLASFGAQMLWKLLSENKLTYNQLFWNSELMHVSTKLEMK